MLNKEEKKSIGLDAAVKGFLETFENLPFNQTIRESLEFVEAKTFFANYLKSVRSGEFPPRLDLHKFLIFILTRFRKNSERDAEILLGVLQAIDLCLGDDLNVLRCLYGDKLNSIRAYTVFECKEPLLSLRRQKLKKMADYAQKKAFYTKKVFDLVKECEFTLKEYEAFLWLRLLKKNVTSKNAFAVWAIVLSYYLFHEIENSPILSFGPYSVHLGEVVRNVFVRDPNFSSVVKTFLYLCKKCGKNKEEVKKLKVFCADLKNLKI